MVPVPHGLHERYTMLKYKYTTVFIVAFLAVFIYIWKRGSNR